MFVHLLHMCCQTDERVLRMCVFCLLPCVLQAALHLTSHGHRTQVFLYNHTWQLKKAKQWPLKQETVKLNNHKILNSNNSQCWEKEHSAQIHIALIEKLSFLWRPHGSWVEKKRYFVNCFQFTNLCVLYEGWSSIHNSKKSKISIDVSQ